MPTAVKIIILVVVLIVVLLLFYYVIPDSSGTTPAQRKAGIQPYQLAQQGEAKKPGVDVGRLVGGILQLLKGAADFIVKSVKKGAGKATGKSGTESDPYGGKYDNLDNMNIDGIYNQSLDNNSPIGGYTQSGNDFSFFSDIFAGGGGDTSMPVGTSGNYGEGAGSYGLQEVSIG